LYNPRAIGLLQRPKRAARGDEPADSLHPRGSVGRFCAFRTTASAALSEWAVARATTTERRSNALEKDARVLPQQQLVSLRGFSGR